MLPAAITLIAAAQHGVIARWQALAAGVSSCAFDGLVRRRRLVRLAYGVYRIPGSPEAWEQEAVAAVLAAGPTACADGPTSCRLHRLEGFARHRRTGALLPWLPGVRQEPSRAVVARFDEADVVMVSGIRALTASRAIIEVAGPLSDRALRVLIDSARRRGLISIDRLERDALPLPLHAGARAVLRLLGTGAADKESEGERRLEPFLAALGMTLEWGVSDVVPGRRLDAYERALRIGYEYDGRDHHVLPTDRDADGLRDLECEVAGVLVIRITWGMLDEHPQQTLELIAAIRRRRAAELGLPQPA